MGGSGSNFNQMARDVQADQGFNRDLDIFNLLTDEAGTPIGAGTTPVRVVTSDEVFNRWAASNVDAMYANVRIPRSAAFSPLKTQTAPNEPSNVPYLRGKLHIVAKMSGSSDTPRMTVTAKARNNTGSLKATFTPSSIDSDGTTVLTNGTGKALSSSLQEIVYDFFGKAGTGPVYLAPGDRLDLKIVPGTHGTDTVDLYDAWLELWENGNLTDESLRS